VLPGETAPALVNMQDYHRECVIRIVVGSAAHQLGDCTCSGGRREDPASMTKRQAAVLAVETYEMLGSAAQ
jgi:hypothetical protein